jgi:hypothetical protein
MLLTTNGKAVGLGQVWNVLAEDASKTRRRVCSCGVSALTCEFWSAIIDRIKDDRLTSAERYQIVLDNVEHLYGPDIAVIDSSKLASNLKILACDVPNADLTVLHNIKDVRSFTISMLDNSKRKGYRRELPEIIFYRWYRDNRQANAEATALLGAPPVRVTYEGLCLATEAVADRLAERLGERYVDLNTAINSGRSHIISGNRLRLTEPERATRIAYDTRWMMRSEWLRPYIFMPMVRRYNEECLRELGSVT